MGTILGQIKNIKLRNKLAIIYTVAFTLILGLTFIFIYSYSEKYRKEEFYQRLSDRTVTTFKISIQVDQIDNRLLKIFDKNRINSLSDETVLLFDSSYQLLYFSSDSSATDFTQIILNKLSGGQDIYKCTDGEYELLGLKFQDKNKTYFGIIRAYDRFGKSKNRFLALSLLFAFAIVSTIIVLLSFYLSEIITRPITKLTQSIEKISPDDLANRVPMPASRDEIGFLSNKFNELLDKVENAFKFQFHYIHHISHELKTPLAIMMANAERALAEGETEKLVGSMQFQKSAIMEISNIINALLDISKMEKKLSVLRSESIRIDEIVFECVDEIIFLNPEIRFDFKMDEALNELNLTILGNSRMIKMATLNLLKNAVNFSGQENPLIEIISSQNNLEIRIINDGETIGTEEQIGLFKHSFRGKNSHGVKGFGLGLVLAARIISIHEGTLKYEIAEGKNCFILTLPA